MTNRVKAVGQFDDKISGPLDRVRDKFDRLQKQGAKGIAIGVGAAATTKAFDLLGNAVGAAFDQVDKSIHAASALNEQMSKSEVVFGGAADEIQAFAKSAADGLGLSERAALEAAGAFGQFFTGAGQSAGAAEDMSERMVKLAADLASFNNLDPTEVLQNLQSGLAGEAEPLRKMGVFLTEAKVKAKGMEMGLADAHGELTEGEKILARYQIILDETGKAQGDFERTSDSLANAERRKAAALENAQARFGQSLVGSAAALQNLETDFLNFAASGIEGWTMLGKELDGSAEAARQADRDALAMAVSLDNAKRAGHGLTAEARELRASLVDVSDESRDVASDVREMRRQLDNAAAAAKGMDGAMEDLDEILFGAAQRTGELAQAKKDLDDILREGPESKSAADMAIWEAQVAEARQRVFDLQMQMAQSAGPEAFRDWLLQQKRVLDEDLNPALAETLDLLLQINAQQLNAGGGGKSTKGKTADGGSAPAAPAPAPSTDVPHGAEIPEFGLGGVVPGPRGKGRVVIAHGGEVIIPPELVGGAPMAGSSPRFAAAAPAPIVVQLVVDGRVLAEAVARPDYYSQSPATGALPD